MRKVIATLLVATFSSVLLVSVAQAAQTQVNVRIEGREETLFEGPVLVESDGVRASSDAQSRSCNGINSLDPLNVTPAPTPTAASADALGLIGETFDGQWYPGFNDYFITRWGPDLQSPGEAAYWGILVNDTFTNVGGCQYQLDGGDEVLWVYDAFKGRPDLALFPEAANYATGPRPLTATVALNQPIAVEAVAFEDNEENNPRGRSGSHRIDPHRQRRNRPGPDVGQRLRAGQHQILGDGQIERRRKSHAHLQRTGLVPGQGDHRRRRGRKRDPFEPPRHLRHRRRADESARRRDELQRTPGGRPGQGRAADRRRSRPSHHGRRWRRRIGR